MAVLIIAEAGVNHNGDLGIGKSLVEVAATSGADFVKFQTFNADKLVTPKTKVAEYQNNILDKDSTQLKLLKKLELSENQHFELKKKCKVVQDKISKVVEKIPVGNINIIELNLKKDSLQDNKERTKENDLPGNMHS